MLGLNHFTIYSYPPPTFIQKTHNSHCEQQQSNKLGKEIHRDMRMSTCFMKFSEYYTTETKKQNYF